MPRPTAASRAVVVATAAALLATLTNGCVATTTGSRAGAQSRPLSGPAAAPIDTPDLPSALTRQTPRWSECPASGGSTSPAPLPDGTAWQCATLTAPLDYRTPGRGTVDLALIRARSSGEKAERLGSLLFNFGGPGSSGVDTLPALSHAYEQLRTRYDLVSFDPRGVSRSAGVNCLEDSRLDAYYAADWTPDDQAEKKRLFHRQRQYATACRKNSGAVLPYLTTEHTARDLDLTREVLGDARLHYFGISYGTELGGVYAHLFPRRVGRAIFDGVVDPTQDPIRGALSQARGFQRALGAFLRSCTAEPEHRARPSPCFSRGAPKDRARKIAQLLRRLDARTMPASDSDRPLTESLAANGITQSLYSRDLWDYLSQGLKEATAGEGRTLLALGDAMVGRSHRGTYTSLQASLTAIRCADIRQRYGIEDIERVLPSFVEASPIFGPMTAWGLAGCVGWPVRPGAGGPKVYAKGSAPILLVGTTGDPATPYPGTRRMKAALGEGVGVELTYEGDGHGAYNSGSGCVVKTVNAYLLRGKLPADGTRCS